MIHFVRKIDEYAWHCPHFCQHASADKDSYPKAFRYSTVAHVMQGRPVAVAALSLTISAQGGSLMFHRAWGVQLPSDLQECDLVGRCSVAAAIKGGGSDVSVPVRGVGPWAGKSKAATLANLKLGSDPGMDFMRQFATSGSRQQPETFWHALQAKLVGLAAPYLAQGGTGP